MNCEHKSQSITHFRNFLGLSLLFVLKFGILGHCSSMLLFIFVSGQQSIVSHVIAHIEFSFHKKVY
jgi:hypothetical protein